MKQGGAGALSEERHGVDARFNITVEHTNFQKARWHAFQLEAVEVPLSLGAMSCEKGPRGSE